MHGPTTRLLIHLMRAVRSVSTGKAVNRYLPLPYSRANAPPWRPCSTARLVHQPPPLPCRTPLCPAVPLPRPPHRTSCLAHQPHPYPLPYAAVRPLPNRPCPTAAMLHFLPRPPQPSLTPAVHCRTCTAAPQPAQPHARHAALHGGHAGAPGQPAAVHGALAKQLCAVRY